MKHTKHTKAIATIAATLAAFLTEAARDRVAYLSDLEGLATTNYVQQAVSAGSEAIVEETDPVYKSEKLKYATTGDVARVAAEVTTLRGEAITNEVDPSAVISDGRLMVKGFVVQTNGLYLTEHQSLSAYSTTEQMQTYVTEVLEQAIGGDDYLPGSDIHIDITESDPTAILDNGTLTVKGFMVQTNGDYVLSSELPSKVSDLQNDSGFITSSSLSSYAYRSEIPKKITDLSDSSLYPKTSDVSGIITRTVTADYIEGLGISGGGITSESDPVFTTWRDGNGYVRSESDPSAILVDGKLTVKGFSVQTNGTYLTEHQSLEGYARTEDVSAAVAEAIDTDAYLTTNALEHLATTNELSDLFQSISIYNVVDTNMSLVVPEGDNLSTLDNEGRFSRFNDTRSASTATFGVANKTGLKGYRYTSVNMDEQSITFDTVPDGWEVGDTLSIINKSKYPDAAKIVAMDGNKVYLGSLTSARGDKIISAGTVNYTLPDTSYTCTNIAYDEGIEYEALCSVLNLTEAGLPAVTMIDSKQLNDRTSKNDFQQFLNYGLVGYRRDIVYKSGWGYNWYKRYVDTEKSGWFPTNEHPMAASRVNTIALHTSSLVPDQTILYLSEPLQESLIKQNSPIGVVMANGTTNMVKLAADAKAGDTRIRIRKTAELYPTLASEGGIQPNWDLNKIHVKSWRRRKLYVGSIMRVYNGIGIIADAWDVIGEYLRSLTPVAYVRPYITNPDVVREVIIYNKETPLGLRFDSWGLTHGGHEDTEGFLNIVTDGTIKWEANDTLSIIDNGTKHEDSCSISRIETEAFEGGVSNTVYVTSSTPGFPFGPDIPMITPIHSAARDDEEEDDPLDHVTVRFTPGYSPKSQTAYVSGRPDPGATNVVIEVSTNGTPLIVKGKNVVVGGSLAFSFGGAFSRDSNGNAIINEDGGFDHQTCYVAAKPDCGNIDIGIGAFTEGVHNDNLGFAAHVEGYMNCATQQYAHVEGRNNVASYSAHAEGQGNKALGFWSHAAGRAANALDQLSWVWSNGNGYNSHGQGTFNINPTGGTKGFYIGEKSLSEILGLPDSGGSSTPSESSIIGSISNMVEKLAEDERGKGLMYGRYGTTNAVNEAGVTNNFHYIEMKGYDASTDDDVQFVLAIGDDTSSPYAASFPLYQGSPNRREIYSAQTIDILMSNMWQRIERLERAVEANGIDLSQYDDPSGSQQEGE